MKKILIAIFVLLLIFAFIRISTSTYENFMRRYENAVLYTFNYTTCDFGAGIS